MPAKLTTTINKIQFLPNRTNSIIIGEFHEYMGKTDSSVHHINNNLKVIIVFANFLGPTVTLYDIKKKEQVLAFLNTMVKDPDHDPEKRWITTWNHYLNRIRLFFRWFCNRRGKEADENEFSQSDWETPQFVKIKTKKTKRTSPYLETEIWERDEILFIIKYEPYIRNKAALTLFWDLFRDGLLKHTSFHVKPHEIQL
jgi:integrase/recombinase XerD